jgi:aspartate aminotransferase
VAAPVQYAATVAYSDDPDIASYVATCTAIHGQVTGFLHRTLTEAGLPCPRPSGGFYLYPSFAPWREALERRHRVTNSIELANLLLNEEHIATLPGPDFGDAPQNLTLRLSTSYLYALDDGDAEAVLKVYETTAGAADFLPQACPRVIEVAGQWRAFAQGLA